jgi:uncharacterized ParB-like nuclease family protein
MKAISCVRPIARGGTMDPTKVAQVVEVLNGPTARDALCLLVGCMLTILDEAPSD